MAEAIAGIRERWKSYWDPWQAFADAAKYFLQDLVAHIRLGDVGALGRLRAIASRSFARWYTTFGHHFARHEESMAIPSLVRSARGTVLELGPCTGNQVQRLDATRIGHVYGIEPNAAFAATLARRVSEAGLEARYTPVWAPLERAGPELGRLGVARGSVDCVLCIQVACSTRQPEELVRHCWDWLRPGGELIFCEHGASHDALTRVVQGLWNIMWPWFVGGCQLTWSMERCLRAAPWEVVDMQTDETPASLFPRTWGRLRKPLDANP